MQELRYALESGVGDIVVDNLNELHRIEKLSAEKGVVTSISMRIKPGIDAHTHEFIRTGQIDSKFGFALENGEAFEAVKEAVACENVARPPSTALSGRAPISSVPSICATACR